MKKKTVVVALAMLCVLGSLVWASGQRDEQAKKAAEPITLNFWFPTASEVSDAAFVQHAEEFSKLNPGIKVVTTAIASHGAEMEQKLNTAQLAGTFPDVFSSVLFLIGTRGAKGDFLEITKYVDSWADKSDLLQSALDMGYYKGKLIGLGYFPAPIMNVYRKDFYAEAGLDPNKGPSNWEELRAFAKKATVYDNAGNIKRAGMDLPTSDGQVVVYEAYARNNGSEVIDEVNQVPAFTDSGSVGALQYLADLWKEKISFPFHMQDFGNYPFMNNRSALGMMMTNLITQMVKGDPAVKAQLGYAPPLTHKVKKNFCGYRLFTIGVNSKHPNESWDFIKFMMSPENIKLREEKVGTPPPRKSMAEAYIKKDPELNAAILEHVEFGKGKPVTPWTSIYSQYMSVAYEEALSGKKTAQQAITDADRELRAELKKQGYLK
jgi:ABC-type glycerol-3-phosphate transport system substrate-binding protein